MMLSDSCTKIIVLFITFKQWVDVEDAMEAQTTAKSELQCTCIIYKWQEIARIPASTFSATAPQLNAASDSGGYQPESIPQIEPGVCSHCDSG